MNLVAADVDSEVSIIGAGPVGSFLAGMLAYNGVDVALFDKEQDSVESPRAMAVNARTAQILDTFDLREKLLLGPPVDYGHYGRMKVNLTHVSTPWPGMWKIQQQHLNNELLIWAINAGVRLIRGAKLTNLQENHSGYVKCTFEGSIKSTTSRLLVGCDGETSSVRYLAGLGKEVAAGKRRFVTANLQSTDLPSFRFEQFADGAVVSTGLIDTDMYRIMMHVPSSTPVLSTSEDIKTVWQMITGSSLQGKLLSWGIQTDRTLLAASFNTSRTLLAGDAAHSQLPVGGCSLNYGIEDAFNLAWRIYQSLKNDRLDLFEDYTIERRFAAHRMQNFVRSQTEELYGSRRPIGKLAVMGYSSEPKDPAGFISGTDVDYRLCGTGTTSLVSLDKVLRDSQHCEIKYAQQNFKYSYISTNNSIHKIDYMQDEQPLNKAASKYCIDGRTESLIRPDGYITTDF